MKVITTFSGGKDSFASLLWIIDNITPTPMVVFCDTGWESPITYKHINDVIEKLGLKLITLKSKKYDGMLDLGEKKGRFPSTKARFCTEELKAKPMIDFILEEVKDHCLIIQGIRGDESPARSLMSKQCRYFKYYFEPYGFDKKKKPKYHNYRAKEVKAFCKTYCDDILRPVFNWTAQEVINKDGIQASFSRTSDIRKYLSNKNATMDMFSEPTSCMSFYGLCE